MLFDNSVGHKRLLTNIKKIEALTENVPGAGTSFRKWWTVSVSKNSKIVLEVLFGKRGGLLSDVSRTNHHLHFQNVIPKRNWNLYPNFMCRNSRLEDSSLRSGVS